MPAGRTAAAAVLLVGALLATAFAPRAQAEAPAMRFGMGMGDVDALTKLGAKPSLGVYWTGPWIQTHGWSGVDAALDKAYATGTTPVIQFWYWGDSISPSCVEHGCYASIHKEQLTRASWNAMAATLASKIQTKMQGREAIVILESEFNKQGIDSETYAPVFDAYLAEHMATFHKVPGAKVAIGFGNWGQDKWDRFPKALAGSDYLGFQTMRASTRSSLQDYTGAIDAVKSASARLHDKYGKPTLLHDLALSSHPEPEYLTHQASEIKELFDRREELAAAGLAGVAYRTLQDNPDFDAANYFGEAERHWGLRKADGSAKPALQHWIEGVSAKPAPHVGPGLALEAESFGVKTTGGLSTSGSPSGGAAWNLWSNGEIRTPVNVTATGPHLVTLRARGDLAGPDAPRMVLKIDGAAQASFDVGLTTFSDHTVTLNLTAGLRSVAVAFTNDDSASGSDRNLVVDLVRLEPAAAPAPQPEPRPEPQPEPMPSPNPVPIVPELSARAYRLMGLQQVDLSWKGAATPSVDLWRDGARVATTANDGAHTDSLDKKGGGSYAYRVCEAGSGVCSAEVRVTF